MPDPTQSECDPSAPPLPEGWDQVRDRYDEAIANLVEAGLRSDGRSLQPRTLDERADATMRKGMVEVVFASIWAGRQRAREQRDAVLHAAAADTWSRPQALRRAARPLAERLLARNPDAALEAALEAVLRVVVPEWQHEEPITWRTPLAWDFAETGLLHDPKLCHLLYEAACQLRAVGRLSGAYLGFLFSRPLWFLNEPEVPDDLLPRRAWGSPFGIPRLGPRSWLTMSHWEVDTLSIVPWQRWAHVVGCGTTISHTLLDALGVPKEKQHVVEVHRAEPRPRDPPPVLRGPVVVVDDVHEGWTAFTLARLWKAPVIAVGPECCVRLTSRHCPIMQVPWPKR